MDLPTSTRIFLLVTIAVSTIQLGNGRSALPRIESIPRLDQESTEQINHMITDLDDRLTKQEGKTKPEDAFMVRQEKRSLRESIGKLANYHKEKFQWGKLKSVADKYNDVVKLVSSDDPNIRLEAVFSLIASAGDVIPGPIGAIIGTVFSLVAATYKQKAPGMLEKIEDIVLSKIQERHYRDLRQLFTEKQTDVDLLMRDLNITNRKMDERILKCVRKKPEVDQDAADQACDQEEKASQQNRKMWRKLLENSKPNVDEIISQLAAVRQVITDESQAITSFAHLEQVYDILLLYAELQAKHQRLLRDLDNVYNVYLQGKDSHPNYAQDRIDYDVSKAREWERNTLRHPTTPEGAAFALYIIHKNTTNPVFSKLARKLTGPMQGLRKGNIKIKYSPSNGESFYLTVTQDFHDTRLMYSKKCYNFKPQIIGGRHSHSAWMSTCDGKHTADKFDEMKLQLVDRKQRSKGAHLLIPPQNGHESMYIDFDSEGYLYGNPDAKRATASGFMLFPIYKNEKDDGKAGWLIMTTQEGSNPTSLFTLWTIYDSGIWGNDLQRALWWKKNENFDDFKNIKKHIFTVL